MSEWYESELETAELGDGRLNERFGSILEALTARPNVSIPASLGGRAEMEAAYRFFGNEKVMPEKILKPHFAATVKRCKEQKVVLCVQDTTELDFTRPKQQVAGAGPLDGGKRRGAFLHLSETFTEAGTPLGGIEAKMWVREDHDESHPRLTKAEKHKKRKSIPIEEKESIRWIEGIQASQKLAEQCPETTVISLSDSEGDIYELFVAPRTTDNFHFIVRAGQERAVLDETGVIQGVIRTAVMSHPVLFTNEITVRGREQLVSCETSSRRQRKAAASRMSCRSLPQNRSCYSLVFSSEQ